MEQQTPHYDPNIINCDDIPDTISIASTAEKLKKPKKKLKRKINFYKNMDNLLITTKIKKKKKFKCVLYCEGSESIVRSAYNVCREEAYYERIVPICLRDMCTDISGCCRSTLSREKKNLNPKDGSLSPVSSIALTDAFAYNNLSYEDVSNGSFSSDSEELDTLIKRTKQREKEIRHLYPSREYTSTPISKIDYIPTPSPYSIDTDKKSIHSDNTMVLNPISDAYSPTPSLLDAIKIEDDVISNDVNGPYSPDLIKIGNMDYSPVRTDNGNEPYSPTFTPESIELDETTINPNVNGPACSSVFVKMENVDNTTMNNAGIKKEDLNRLNMNAYENVRYSPSSPTATPDYHKYAVTTQSNAKKNLNAASTITMIKQEMINDEYVANNCNSSPKSALEKDWIKEKLVRNIMITLLKLIIT
ncbi:uncharacterized protein LOC125232624 isoform X2 [Leguminivora glycinivorella]|uniref:uncharacterized protein LOC125232624 isoform X2 n=1 Tax=Leguminivora glycinivorella TaxID=1035111 RepID=UPI00200C92CA|nr:uncharacterized protein LOC125232624 isoform X2 [Leguminivora glycinivorella]